MIYGYARVSTNQQDTELQRLALEAAGASRQYISGVYGIGISTLYKKFPVAESL